MADCIVFRSRLNTGNLSRWYKGGASTNTVALGTSFM